MSGGTLAIAGDRASLAAPMSPGSRVVRLAAVGDLHCSRSTHGALQPLFARAAADADVLVLCGDLTDAGLPEEARILAREVAAVKTPVVAVLGNHDYEAGKADEVRQILCDAGVNLLDGDPFEFRGLGIAGVKGFGGGFGPHALQPWGEDITKRFVHETIQEALMLESALARLRTEHRIVLLHYAPIEATVLGEPREIFPFLGSSRLEDPLSRYPPCAVLHGHAHRGQLEGRTRDGVPVYNVSMPVLERTFPDRPPFHVIELSVPDPPDGPPRGAGR
jgi:Icc-related predicted phosphoesterase